MINIDESVLDIVPKAFKKLVKGKYRLTKIESFREGFVHAGDTCVGDLTIVKLPREPLAAAVRVVGSRFNDYLRTSPIVEVLDSNKSFVVFKTEGGVYRLERVLDKETK